MTERIKIFGERNTNTNYLSELFRLNLNVEQVPGVVPRRLARRSRELPDPELARDRYFRRNFALTLGWKHSLVNVEELTSQETVDHSLAFVSITKNPYSWLLSLYRRPYHNAPEGHLDFEEFLLRPWETVGRDNAPPQLRSPMELWNLKNRSYLSLRQMNGLNLRTEDLFRDAAGVIDLVAGTFAIERLQPDFVDFEQSTKNDDLKDGSYYRDYYLNEKWRADLSPRAVSLINDEIDIDLVDHFGYSVIVA